MVMDDKWSRNNEFSFGGQFPNWTRIWHLLTTISWPRSHHPQQVPYLVVIYHVRGWSTCEIFKFPSSSLLLKNVLTVNDPPPKLQRNEILCMILITHRPTHLSTVLIIGTAERGGGGGGGNCVTREATMSNYWARFPIIWWVITELRIRWHKVRGPLLITDI